MSEEQIVQNPAAPAAPAASAVSPAPAAPAASAVSPATAATSGPGQSAAAPAAAQPAPGATGDAPPAKGHDTLLKGGADPDAEAAKADTEYKAQRDRLEADYKKQWSQTVKQWREQAQADPDMGGDRLPSTVSRAQLALNRFDPDGTLGGWLAESGYGNHPEVLRFFNRIADAMAEDGVVQGRGTGERLPLEERMYGHWTP